MSKERKTGKEIKKEFLARIRQKLVDKEPLVHISRWKTKRIPSLPYNIITGKEYSGINPMNLLMEMEDRGFVNPAFIPYSQIKKNGFTLKEGEFSKPFEVVYTDFLEREDVDKDGNKRYDDDGNVIMKRIPFLKFHQVYCADQVLGLPLENVPEALQQEDGAFKLLDTARETMGVKYTESQKGCYYSPSRDSVNMIPRSQFANDYLFLATYAHELAHATGHESRENRDFSGRRDMETKHLYAREEMVAEMASVLLTTSLGITLEDGAVVQSETHGEDHEAHINYMASWAQHVDDKEFEKAVNDATKASQRLLHAVGMVRDPLNVEVIKPKVGDQVIFSGPEKIDGKFTLRSVTGTVNKILHDKDGEAVAYMLEPLALDFNDAGQLPASYYSVEDGKIELLLCLMRYKADFTFSDASLNMTYEPKDYTLSEGRALFKGKNIDKMLANFGFEKPYDFQHRQQHNINAFHRRVPFDTTLVFDEKPIVVDTPEFHTYVAEVAHHLSMMYGRSFVNPLETYPDLTTVNEVLAHWPLNDTISHLNGIGMNVYDLDVADKPLDVAMYWGEKYQLKAVGESAPLVERKDFKAVAEWGRFDMLNTMAWVAQWDGEQYQVQLTARGLPVHNAKDCPIPNMQEAIQDVLQGMRKESKNPDELHTLTLPIAPHTWTVKSIEGASKDVKRLGNLMMLKKPWLGMGDADNTLYKASIARYVSMKFGEEKTGPIPAMDIKGTLEFWNAHPVGLDTIIRSMGITDGMVVEARTKGRTPNEFVSLYARNKGWTPTKTEPTTSKPTTTTKKAPTKKQPEPEQKQDYDAPGMS